VAYHPPPTLIPRRQLVLADLVPGARVRDALLVVGAAGFVGLLAQLVIHLPFTPVPVTGQTLGVLVSGTALGWRRGAAALVLYAAAGVLGLPWFAGHASGWAGASFGYILGFVVAAAACGWLAERGADRQVWRALPAMLVGEIAVYAVGVPWLAASLHVGPGKAISLGLTPFLAGDAVKVALAAGLLPAAWRLAGPPPAAADRP